MKNHTVEEITAALKEAGFSKVMSFHHKSKPWLSVFCFMLQSGGSSNTNRNWRFTVIHPLSRRGGLILEKFRNRKCRPGILKKIHELVLYQVADRGSCRIFETGNVIHLLDEPLKALSELNRVCKPGGMLIIPTYMNREKRRGKAVLFQQSGRPGQTLRDSSQ